MSNLYPPVVLDDPLMWNLSWCYVCFWGWLGCVLEDELLHAKGNNPVVSKLIYVLETYVRALVANGKGVYILNLGIWEARSLEARGSRVGTPRLRCINLTVVQLLFIIDNINRTSERRPPYPSSEEHNREQCGDYFITVN